MTVEAAITKIQNEMNSNEKDGNVQLVGNFLIQHISKNPLDMEKMLDEKKTIKGSVGEIRKSAKNGATDPLSGFNAVLKYFDIDKQFTMEEFFGSMPTQQSTQSNAQHVPSLSARSGLKTSLSDYM